MSGASIASASSFGSAVELGHGRKDNAAEFEQDGHSSAESAVLALAYTVAKDKEDTPRWFAVIRLAAEFMQLWLLILNPDFGWQYDDRNNVFQLVSILNLKDFMGARGYSFYLAVMYIMFIALLSVIALSAYVGWSMQNNRLDSKWPVRVLRFFSAIFCQVLDIAVLNLFLIALDCNYFDQTPLNGNREFPSAVPNCWVAPHLIHAGVAVVSLLIFIPLGLLDALSRMELNPTSRSWLAMNHSKTEIVTLGLKVVATAMCVFVTNYKWLSVGLGVCALLLAINFIRWVPYMHDWANHARAASFTCVLFCAIVLTFSIYHPGIEWDDSDGIRDYRQKATDVLWAGMGPAMCLGALLSYLRLRHFRVTVVGRFARAKPGTKPKYIHKFTDVRQVEIAARCCRHWIDQDTLEPGKVTLAEQIIKAGLIQLPTSAFMIIFHASFLIEVQSSFQSGYARLQAAHFRKPGLLERYAIFIREQQHTQKAGDVVSFVEMMRNYRMVHKAHKEALLATRAFWQALLHHTISFTALSNAVKRLDKAVRTADQVYRSVLQKNSNSVKLLRIYAKFLHHVKHDPWSASKWAAEAQRLHQLEEERKNNIFSDLKGTEDEAGQPVWVKHMANIEEGKAVIIMDAQCMIQAANQVAHNVFGYGKNELRGRNINILIPPPFAEHHDTYVKNYIQTGRGQILDKDSEFVALHKERYVFAVTVHVTKVMGMGQDSIFMGMLAPLPVAANTATAWVMANGAVLSVDATFTDMFGYHPEDLLGSNINSLVPEHARLNETFTVMKDENSRYQEAQEARRAAEHVRRMQIALTNESPSHHRQQQHHHVMHVGTAETEQAHAIEHHPSGEAGVVQRGSEHSTGLSEAAHPAAEQRQDQDPPALTGRRSMSSLGTALVHFSEQHTNVSSGRRKSLSSSQVETHGVTEGSNFPRKSTDKHHGRRSSEISSLFMPQLSKRTSEVGHLTVHTTVTEEEDVLQVPRTGTLQKTWQLEGFHVKHKYTDSIPINMEIKHGGVGTHLFYVLQMQLPTHRPGEMMLVTDKQGRLQHVTQDLAAALGKSVHTLCANGNINALEALMPEPFGLLHRAFLAAPAAPMVPPHSCRTGAAIMLQGQDNDGPIQLPFRIKGMRKHEDVKAGSTQHVVALEQVDLSQALDDRRLTLLINTSGRVVKVGTSSPSLFGFEPSELLGRCITSVIDCLAPSRSSDATRGCEPSLDGDDPQEVAHVMLQLTKRAALQPGTSWRVGVVTPPDPSIDVQALGQIERVMLDASKKITPAVMTVAIQQPVAQDHAAPSGNEQPMADSPGALATSTTADAVQLVDAVLEAETAAGSEVEANVVLPAPAPTQPELELQLEEKLEEDVPPSCSPAPGHSNTAPQATQHDAGLLIEVNLWRADMLSGILEVEPSGKIVSSLTHKLNPPGLVFGCSDECLISRPVASLLPIKGKMANLFQDSLAEDLPLKHRKSLLKSKEGTERVDRFAGPRHKMQVIHAGDQTEMELEVQVVRRAPPARTLYLLLHPVNPRCGRPDFREWLDSPDWDITATPLPRPIPTAALSPTTPRPPDCTSSPHGVAPRSRARGQSSVGGPCPPPPFGKGSNSSSAEANATFMQDGRTHAAAQLNQRAVLGKTGSQEMGSLVQQSSSFLYSPRPPPIAPLLMPVPPQGPSIPAMGMPNITALRTGGAVAAQEPSDPISRTAEWILKDAASQHPQPPSVLLSPLPSGRKHPHKLVLPQGAEPAYPRMDSRPFGSTGGRPARQQSQESEILLAALGYKDLGSADMVVYATGNENGLLEGADAKDQALSGSIPDPLASVGGSYGAATKAGLPLSAPYVSAPALARGLTKDSLLTSPIYRSLTQGSITGAIKVNSVTGMPPGKLTAAYGSNLAPSQPSLSQQSSSSSSSEIGVEADQDPQLIEAAAHLADEAGALQERFSEQLSSEETGGGNKLQGDVRRGTRFRKLFKRLSGKAFQRTLQRFKTHSLVLMALLFTVRIAMFAVVYSLLQSQQEQVDHFSLTGKGAQQVAQIATIVNDIDIFLTNRTVPGLPGLDSQQDFVDMLETLKGMIETFLVQHDNTYLGFGQGVSRLPDSYGLRAIWDLNGTQEISFYDSRNTSSHLPTNKTRTRGLWETGNEYGRQALWVYDNWMIRANETGTRGPWIDWAPVQYVLYNGVYQVLTGYYSTMDGLAQVLIADFTKLNHMQLALMGAEALGLCAFVCVYMYILLNQVNNYRFALYNTFVLVPMAMSRALAHRPLALDDDDDEDEVELNGGGLLGGGGKEVTTSASVVGGKSLAWEGSEGAKSGAAFDGKASTRGGRTMSGGLSLGQPEEEDGWLRSLVYRLKSALSGGFGDANAGGKRQLEHSRRATAWLLWPFVLWGILLLILYLVAYESLKDISSPLATLNIVTFVAVRFTRTIFFAQKLAWTQGVAAKAAARSAMVASINPLLVNYRAMLYGAAGVPGETSAHFTEAKDGLAFVGGQGTDILYKPGTCLRVNQSTCLTPDNPDYQFTVNGLDKLMTEYFRSIDLMLNTTGEDPKLDSPVFRYIWETRPDILGGLDRLVAAYRAHLSEVYDYTLSIHIAAFVLTALLLIVYLAFMWRPFLKEATAETRRVAELLTQLPTEINVEELVTRSVFPRARLSLLDGANKSFTSRSMSSMQSFRDV